MARPIDPQKQAYLAAKEICQRHARSFYFSSFFLPKAKRDAAYAVYAFCRMLDDATDEAEKPGEIKRQIDRFRMVLDRIYRGNSAIAGFTTDEVLALIAFLDTVKRYEIPKNLFVEVIEGCRMDVGISRYQTWEELRKYCYRVAGVVGLIMCRIFGLSEPDAERQAVQMGEAMQLTNILRDVKEDYARGRIYLPLEDLQKFGYTEAELAAGVINDSFRALMKFEIARARELYQSGSYGLRHLPNDGSRFTASAMGIIYAGILRAIERQKYDVFANRARLSLSRKLLGLPAARRMSRIDGDDAMPNVF